MDLQLSAEQLQLRDASRRLIVDRLGALVERLPEPPVHDAARALQDAQALGWLGLGLPEKVGGAGGFEDLALVHEELGRGLAPSFVTSLGVAGRVLLHGTPLREDLLSALCEGSRRIVPALGNPVTRTGSRLEGTVRHVADAAHATDLLVLAGDQILLVPAGALVREEPSQCDLVTATVELGDVETWEVVASSATPVLRRVRSEATVLAAARAVGGGRAVLERTVQHVSTRHQFGRAIGTFQAVQHQLADVAIALDAAGLALARAAWAVDAGADDVRAAATVAGLAAREAYAQATLVAHQLHGGMGFVLDSPLHLWSARAVADPTCPGSRRSLLDELSSELSEQRR